MGNTRTMVESAESECRVPSSVGDREPTRGGTCPRCGSPVDPCDVLVAGGYRHDPDEGMSVDGRMLVANPSVHRLMRRLMESRFVVSDHASALAIGYEGDRTSEHMTVIAAYARTSFRRMGASPPFERRRGQGLAWTGGEVRRERRPAPPRICVRCGYDVERDAKIESCGFVHDPVQGRTLLDGQPLEIPSSMHDLIGTVMRANGTGVGNDVIVDRIGHDTEDPCNMVKVLVCRLRKVVAERGFDLPVTSAREGGYRWTGETRRA